MLMNFMQGPPFKITDRYKISSYKAFNDKYPRRYDTSMWMRVCQTSRWDRAVLSELMPGIEALRILDVGCATGRVLYKLARAGARHLAGIDLAPKIIDVASKKLHEQGFQADLKSADAEDALPWPDSTFDVVTMTGVLHHFLRPRAALQEIRRVLCPHGRIIIVDPWFPPLLRQAVNLYLRYFMHDGDCRMYTPKSVVHLLVQLGWIDVRYSKVGWYSFLVTGKSQVYNL